jgi:hypothetical protein
MENNETMKEVVPEGEKMLLLELELEDEESVSIYWIIVGRSLRVLLLSMALLLVVLSVVLVLGLVMASAGMVEG